MAGRPACVASGYALGPKSFHMPRKQRTSGRFAAASGSRHPAREDRPRKLPPCSGPGIPASSAGAEVTRAISVLRPRTPAGKNCQMCARPFLLGSYSPLYKKKGPTLKMMKPVDDRKDGRYAKRRSRLPAPIRLGVAAWAVTLKRRDSQEARPALQLLND